MMKQTFLITLCLLFTLFSCVSPTETESKFSNFSILSPSGPFSVGLTYFYTKSTDKTAKTNTIPIQLWYPATPESHQQHAPYYAPELSSAITDYFKDSPIAAMLLKNPIIEAKISHMKNNSYLNAPLSKKRKQYPLIIFSPQQRQVPQAYTAIIEDLASHGYVVISITQENYFISREKPLSEKTSLQLWNDNLNTLIQVLPQLQQHLDILSKVDLNNIGLIGHGIGGSASLSTCEKTARCKCAVNLDGYFPINTTPTELNKASFAIMTNNQVFLSNEDTKKMQQHKQLQLNLMDLFKRSKQSGPSKYIEIENMDHLSFMDNSQLFPYLEKKGETLSGTVGIKTIRKLLHWFFDTQLKKELQPFPKLKPAVIKTNQVKL